jgi:hypothetical protein
LNNSTELYNDYLFVGSTLWSDIDGVDNSLIKNMNDFKKIKPNNYDKFKLTKSIYTEMFVNNINFLYDTIIKNSDKKIVILTHHLPTYILINEKYTGDLMNCFFASHFLEDLFQPNIKAWLCGHSHSFNEKIINGIYFGLNPYGYPDENKETKLNHCIDLL